jgi:hypothetical protein
MDDISTSTNGATSSPLHTLLETRPLRLETSTPDPSVTTAALALNRAGGDAARAMMMINTHGPIIDPIPHPHPHPTPKPKPVPPTPDKELSPGQQWTSSSGNTMLAYQGDGNLVVYVRRNGVMPTGNSSGGWVARWASNTAGKPAGKTIMQKDGNLVVYGPDGHPFWASNTAGHPTATIAIQDDENVVIYEGDHPLWSSNTWIGGVAHSNFDVASRGFAFINNFPDGYWQFGLLKFATAGLCGGMTFTALDYYWANRTIPANTTTPSAVNDPLGRYINARQQQSVESNLGGWSTQILNPDDHALNYWATHDEWNKVKASIDAGHPLPLGLGVYFNGGASHQVIAVGYREGARERWIITCDPNLPRREGCLHLEPNALHWKDQQGGDWRGYFASSYSPKPAP